METPWSGERAPGGTLWTMETVCILTQLLLIWLYKSVKIHRTVLKKGEFYCIQINPEEKQNQNKCSFFLCWGLDVPASAHTLVKRLYIVLLLISPVFRGFKIRWHCCSGRESHLHSKGREGIWLENSNASLLFVGLSQGSAPNPAHHLFL